MMKLQEKFQALLESGRNTPTAYAKDMHGDVVRFIATQLKTRKMTKKDLAIKIGIKESQVSRLLQADGNMTMLTVCKLYWAFNEKPEIRTKISDSKIIGVSLVRLKGKEIYAKGAVGIPEVEDIYGT